MPPLIMPSTGSRKNTENCSSRRKKQQVSVKQYLYKKNQTMRKIRFDFKNKLYIVCFDFIKDK